MEEKSGWKVKSARAPLLLLRCQTDRLLRSRRTWSEFMDTNLFDISGRVALIAGASRGIGRAIAEGLSQAGATIALSSRTETDLIQVSDRFALVVAARKHFLPIFPAWP